MNNDFKNIVLELFDEAKVGQINIKTDEGEFDIPWRFYVKFFARIEHKNNAVFDENTPVLEIPDLNGFLEKTENYCACAERFYTEDKEYLGIADKNQFYKKLLLDLFINCSPEDFLNIDKFVNNRTNMLLNSQALINSLKLENGKMFSKYFLSKNNNAQNNLYLGNLNAVNATIYADLYKTHTGMDAPLLFLPYLKNNEDVFFLPGVLFGVNVNKNGQKSVFVGAVQNFSDKQDSRFAKNMDRFLRKLNSGVQPESIEANVSPKAVASLVLFLEYAKSLGIENVNASNYAPLRYSAKGGALEKRQGGVVYDTLFDKIDADQYNITNKFMFLFSRIKHHYHNMQLDFSDFGAYLNINFETKNHDNIIYDIASSAENALQHNKNL